MTKYFGYPANKLRISNVPKHVPWEEIKKLVSNIGSIINMEKAPGKTSEDYSITVSFEARSEVERACTELNGYNLDGYVLKVDDVMDPRRSDYRSRSPKDFASFGLRGSGFNQFGSLGTLMHGADFPLRILVLSDMVGAIIGRNGDTIRQITQQSRARVDVHRKENSEAFDKDELCSVQVITIYGNPENCTMACKKIIEVIIQESTNINQGEIPLKILAHNNLVGRIIGKGGKTIKYIMEQTETKIGVSSVYSINNVNMERVITVKGSLENISKAEHIISNKLRHSYESDLSLYMAQSMMNSQTMMFPGVNPMAVMSTMGNTGFPGDCMNPTTTPLYAMYNAPQPQYKMPMMYSPTPPQILDPGKEVVYLYIPNSSVGAIIGVGGSTVRDMTAASGASIKVDQTHKGESTDRQGERKVTIIGSPEAQWKAQYMIFKRVNCETFYQCHLRAEILIPSDQVGRVIGKGGQTVRELQRQTRTVIKLPEDTDCSESNQTAVHVIGDFYCSQAAQRQIRLLVNKSQAFRPSPLPRPSSKRCVEIN